MMRIAVVIALLNLWAPAASAQENKPWWNPFAPSTPTESAAVQNSETRKSSFFDGSNSKKSGLSLPKIGLWPSGKDGEGKTQKTSSKSQPSTLDKVGNTTKQWWNSTTDFLNPFDDAPKQRRGQGYQPQKEQPKSKGMFSWFTEPEEEEITSVTDFIGQPRPRF